MRLYTHTHTHTHYSLNNIKNKKQAFLNALLNIGEVDEKSISPFGASQNRGITLAALVITIVVLLILATITIQEVSGDGIFAKAKKASFYSEMASVNEGKSLSKLLNFMQIGNEEEVESGFLGENLSIEELTALSDTLKAEIFYTRDGYKKGQAIDTKKIWKENMWNYKTNWEDSLTLEGLTANIYYISKESCGKEKTYIYDKTSDICYKIEDTKIGKYIVHSLEYAQLVLDGVNAKGVGIVDIETGTMLSNGVECYEPDLNNFTYSTELIYYSSDKKTTKTLSLKEYINQNRPKSIVVDGVTYTFADYSEINKIWANIKCTANNLETYWVWIPRYAYKLDTTNQKSNIIFVNTQDKQMDGTDLPEGYIVHEGFTQQDGLKGIWFSKYNAVAKETLKVDTSESETPDLSNFKAETTKLIYYTQDLKENIKVDFSLNPEQSIVQNGKTYYFYNYAKKMWANIYCNANGLETYWVWIPRYAYKIESGSISVILVDTNNKPLDTASYGTTIPQGYTLHEGFTQQDGLKGIWFSKYNAVKTEQ